MIITTTIITIKQLSIAMLCICRYISVSCRKEDDKEEEEEKIPKNESEKTIRNDQPYSGFWGYRHPQTFQKIDP